MEADSPPDDDFLESLRQENAEFLGITPEEMDDMNFSEIEHLIEEQHGEPLGIRMPQPGERGYSPLLDPPPTRKELERRSELVEAFLDPDRSARRLKWSYRIQDTYDSLEYVLETGRRYLVDESVEFVRDIRRALGPRA